MPKDALDPTTIEQNIASLIDEHNNAADAHIGEGRALESHRAAEIIDHIAESVVNDKLQHSARTFIAIVGSGIEGDFDTLQGAIDYAAPLGGGNILLMPGIHYLSGAVNLPMSCNIVGIDRETCILTLDANNGDYLKIVNDNVNNQTRLNISKVTINNLSNNGIQDGEDILVGSTKIYFDDCKFTGGYTYMNGFGTSVYLNNCTIALNTNVGFIVGMYIEYVDCEIATTGANNTMNICTPWNTEDGEIDAIFDNCRITAYIYGQSKLFEANGQIWLTFRNTIIEYWYTTNLIAYIREAKNTIIRIRTGCVLELGYTLGYAHIEECEIIGGAANNIKISGNYHVFINNVINGIVNNTGSNNVIKNILPSNTYKVLANSDTACGLARNDCAQLTPNSSRTLTTTVPEAGQDRTLIILTSGTSSYVMTFGSGFKTVGTLTTGTTNARRFVIEFISDGTYLIEKGRTAAIA